MQYSKEYEDRVHELKAEFGIYLSENFTIEQLEQTPKEVFDKMFVFYCRYDWNEEFLCGYCGKEVLWRILYCSNECYEKDETEMASHQGEE